MKKFAFVLEPLLEQRRRREEECQLYVARIHESLVAAEKNLNDAMRVDIERSERPGADQDMMLRAADLHARDGLYAYAAKQQSTIQELSQAAEDARENLLEATRERKIIEALRKNQFIAYRQNQIRAEQRDIEDSNQCRRSGFITHSPWSSSQRF